MNEQNQTQSIINIPTAIVIAALIIGGALIWNNRPAPSAPQGAVEDIAFDIHPVDATDHILGNPKADLVVVEYSDMSCPFCKVFHETMHTIVDDYGKDGRVAWVYRHLPIINLHPLAFKEAIATECAAKTGNGSTAFWDYTDKLFATKIQGAKTDTETLRTIAKNMSLDAAAFNTCLDQEQTKTKVERDFNNGVAISGGRPGTPMSMLVLREPMSEKTEESLVAAIARLPRGYDQLIKIASNREVIKIEGAFPLDAMKAIIDEVLK